MTNKEVTNIKKITGKEVTSRKMTNDSGKRLLGIQSGAHCSLGAPGTKMT